VWRVARIAAVYARVIFTAFKTCIGSYFSDYLGRWIHASDWSFKNLKTLNFFSLARTEENCMLMEPPETWIYQSLDHHPASASIPSIKNDLHISSGACRCQMTLLPWPHRDPTSRLEDLDALLLPPHECLHWRVQWLQKFNRIVSVSIFQQLFRNASMGGVGFGRAADCQFSKPLLNVPQTTPS
jgi:hypothetical protein